MMQTTTRDLVAREKLRVAREELQLRTKIDGNNNEERENERQAAWKEKVLHGQFLTETEGMPDQRR